jgi:hypothetical protein
MDERNQTFKTSVNQTFIRFVGIGRKLNHQSIRDYLNNWKDSSETSDANIESISSANMKDDKHSYTY